MSCPLKDHSEAWNTGLEAFKSSFNGSNTTTALKQAIREIKYKYPKLDFDIESFVNPVVENLKKGDHIDSDYNFFKPKKKLSDEAKRNKVKEKVISVTKKFNKLSQEEQAKFAKKMYYKFEQDGLLDEPAIQDIYADLMGLPSINSPETQDAIKGASSSIKELNDVTKKLDDKIKELVDLKDSGKLTPELDKKIAKEIIDLKNQEDDIKVKAQRAQVKLSAEIKEKRFSELNFVDFMVMNLLSPTTLLMNMTGMLADLSLRIPARAVSSVANTLISAAKGEVTAKHFGGRTIGALKSINFFGSPKALIQAREAAIYNSTKFNREIPRADHLNAVNAFKKMIDDKGALKTTKNFLSFFFRIHPDLVKRGLMGPDALFHEAILGGELNRIANQKNLSGAEKEAFLARPDDKSAEEALKMADEATLRTENALTKKLATNPEQYYNELLEAGWNPIAARSFNFLRYMGTKMLAPFTKSPVNLITLAARFTIPGAEIARTTFLAAKEKDAERRRQIISDGIGVATVGFAIQRMAISLVLSGAISSGFGDDDEKTRESVERRLGGPNRLNYSAFLRLIAGGSAEWQKGDESIELRSLGVFGLILGAHAHAFNKYSKKENEENAKLSNVLSTIPIEGFSTLTSALDNTFLSGTNQFIDVFRSDDDYRRGKYFNTAVATLFTGFAPSTYQKVSMANQENIKQSYDKEKPMLENLYNSLGYKFLFGGGEMKNKYFALAESEGDVIKKKDYMKFDNTLGRALSAELSVFKSKEIKDTPLSRLYDSSKEVEKKERSKMFPPSINKSQTISLENEDVKVSLTDEQYDFLVKKASFYRVLASVNYINSDKFIKDTYEQRAKTLARQYEQGLEAAKVALINEYAGNFNVISKSSSDEEVVRENVEEFKSEEIESIINQETD